MSRFFLSHSGTDNLQAIALKQWLVAENPALAQDIFLDVDPETGISLGIRWREALRQANARCEAVICLLSQQWEKSVECNNEYIAAESSGKRIICARLEPDTGSGRIQEWQWVDMFAPGPFTDIEITYRGEVHVVSFSTAGLQRLRDNTIGQGIGAEAFPWPPEKDQDRAPYRGWEPLEECDAAVFFGRDAQMIHGLDELRSMRQSGASLFVILGPSGAGKSSFLRAGLLPRLRREDRSFVVLDIVRPELNVLTGEAGLAESINSTANGLERSLGSLNDIKNACLADPTRVRQFLLDIQKAAAARLVDVPEDAVPPTVILPVDQAEELFGVDAGPEADAFLEMLGSLAGADAAQRASLIVVMTMRTDHHEALQTAEQLRDIKTETFSDLRPMPPAEFKSVIEGPAKRARNAQHRLSFEPALVDQLLRDCQTGADTLPLLSLTLARLYKEFRGGGDTQLRLRDYDSIGGMRKVVQTEVDSVLSRVPETRLDQLDVLKRAFIPYLATVNPDNDKPVRRVARWSELPAEARPLLEQFVGKRLLVSGGDGDTVEVALEGLLQHWKDLDGWLGEERENLKKAEVLRRDALAWEKHGHEVSYLLEGERLRDAETLFELGHFKSHVADTREFVEQSRKRDQWRERRKRQLQIVVAASAVIALVAVLSGLAWYGSFKNETGLNLVNSAEQILNGGEPGGDVLAMQKLLAARVLDARTADSVVERRRALVRIMENPVKPNSPVTAIYSVAAATIPGADPGDPKDDTDLIASANADGTVQIWNAATGAPLAMLNANHEGGVGPMWSVAFSPDASLIATGNNDGTLQVWHVADGKPVGTPLVRRDDPISSVAFSPSGTVIASGTRTGKLRLSEALTGRLVIAEQTASDEPGTLSVAFRPRPFNVRGSESPIPTGDDFVVSAGGDSVVRLWNARTGEQPVKPVRLGESTSARSVAFGVTLTGVGEIPRIAVGLADGSIHVLDGETLQPLAEPIAAHPGLVFSVAFSPGGKFLLSGGSDNTVRVWDADLDQTARNLASSATFDPIGTPLVGHHGMVTSVVLNSLGNQFISAGLDGSVRVWDAIAGIPIPARQGRTVFAVAFRPLGPNGPAGPDSRDQEMATGGADGTVKLWNPDFGAPVLGLGIPAANSDHAILGLAYSSDGNRLVTGRSDGTIELWSLADLRGARRQPMVSNTGTRQETHSLVTSVAFSPDGSLIATAHDDSTVRLWDGVTLAPLGQINLGYPVLCIAFSPDKDSRLLAVGSGALPLDGELNVQMWNVDSRQRFGDPLLVSPGSGIFSVAFNSTGTKISAGDGSGVVHVWEVDDHEPSTEPLVGDQNAIGSLAFADGDDTWLVAGAADGKLRFWNAEAGNAAYPPIGTPIEAHHGYVYDVAVSDDHRWIVSVGADATLHLWRPPQDLTQLVCSKINNADMTAEQWDQDVSWWVPQRQLCP